jgi:hypothetical protein
MFSIESEIRNYTNTIKESLKSLQNKQQNKVDLNLNQISIIGDFLLLKFCLLEKKITNISIDIKCFVSINKKSNELFIKLWLPLIKDFNLKVIFSDKTFAQITDYSIDWNCVLMRNTNQINHQLMRPFQSCLTFKLNSNHLSKRFDFSKLIQCKPIINANFELNSNSITIYFTRFSHLLLILKWININVDQNIKLSQFKKSNEVIKKSLKTELSFVANIDLKKSDYRSVRKQLFDLEIETDKRISQLF